MLDPQEVYLESADLKTERIAHIYEIYKQELAKSNALDFDDLLLYAVRVLKASGETRERYNRRYRYLLVDEYQDTNRPQYELMRMLAGDEHNVCAVGDEDQSIYSWRGADIRNILEFEQDFPEARIIRLEQNYRSTQNILQAASAVVSHNVRRKGKNLWTDRTGGVKIGYYEAPDGENEALFAADYITKYLAQAGSDGRREAACRGALPYELAIATAGRGHAPLPAEVPRCGRIQLLRTRRDQGPDFLSQGDPEPGRLHRHAADHQYARRAASARTTTETLERIALETGLSLWGAIERNDQSANCCRRGRLAALKAFKQLIDDARAYVLGFVCTSACGDSCHRVARHRDEEDFQHSMDFSPEACSAGEDRTDFDPESFAPVNDGSDDQADAGDQVEGVEGLPHSGRRRIYR